MTIVNTSYLEEVCGGSKEIIKEMVDIFFEQVPEFYNEMTRLMAEQNYHELGLLAHKAKSSVAIMGMENLAARLKELELNSKSGIRTEEYQDIISEFHNETSEAISELKDYINNK